MQIDKSGHYKSIENSIYTSTSIEQLRAVFLKYNQFIFNKWVSESFINRAHFLSIKETNLNIIESINDFITEVQDTTDLNFTLNTSNFTITITLDIDSEDVLKTVSNHIIMYAINRFKGHKSYILNFLGISNDEFKDLLNNNKKLSNCLKNARKENKLDD
jgi:hypothetical protein